MAATDALIGRQLGSFRIERLLGRGGMASVYFGWDLKLHRPVAIKLIEAGGVEDSTQAERFVQEARAAAAWRHPNLVQIYYAGDQDGLYYYVMEYLRGLDLRQLQAQYRARGEWMPNAEVVRIGRAVAQALDYIHNHGVIHRDVKHSNIMVTEAGRVVLTDFGLALDLRQGSRGEVFGSPRYIAPEQARSSNRAVPQSDLYSLGVVLYELLAGRPPFEDPNPMSLAIQHMTLPPPRPRQFNPALNLPVESVLLKALEKAPQDRYQSGAELISALEAALQAAPVTAAPVTLPAQREIADPPTLPAPPVRRPAPPAPHPRRDPWSLAGAGCAVLILLTLLLLIVEIIYLT